MLERLNAPTAFNPPEARGGAGPQVAAYNGGFHGSHWPHPVSGGVIGIDWPVGLPMPASGFDQVQVHVGHLSESRQGPRGARPCHRHGGPINEERSQVSRPRC